jgi:amidohydrolase
MDTAKIKELVKKYYPAAVEIRRQLHMYPEVGFQETNTAKLIEETLTKLGIPVQTGIAQTGVLGIIKGGKSGKTVLLRADMDALEITEEADVEYKSKIPGVMHACAHDGHVAGLLLCAMVLNELKENLCGNVKLMFQPAEERDGGAEPMIKEGILENPKVDAAFACHLWGPLQEGKVLTKKGAFMAAPDEFTIKIIGKGGHGAMPHETIDPIVIAAQVINSIQTIISRSKNPAEPAVVTVGSIHGGTVHNIIPETVEMIGTIRTFDSEVRKWIPQALKERVEGITKAYGADYELEITPRYPPLLNNPQMTELVQTSAAKIIGAANVEEMPIPNMGAEDFSYVCQSVPAAYFFVGIAKDKPIPHHNPKFSWDEKNLLIYAAALCQVAVDFLQD